MSYPDPRRNPSTASESSSPKWREVLGFEQENRPSSTTRHSTNLPPYSPFPEGGPAPEPVLSDLPEVVPGQERNYSLSLAKNSQGPYSYSDYPDLPEVVSGQDRNYSISMIKNNLGSTAEYTDLPEVASPSSIIHPDFSGAQVVPGQERNYSLSLIKNTIGSTAEYTDLPEVHTTPTSVPSRAPSNAPSHAPSNAPSHAPSRALSETPSRAPSHASSRAPSDLSEVVPGQERGYSLSLVKTTLGSTAEYPDSPEVYEQNSFKRSTSGIHRRLAQAYRLGRNPKPPPSSSGSSTYSSRSSVHSSTSQSASQALFPRDMTFQRTRTNNLVLYPTFPSTIASSDPNASTFYISMNIPDISLGSSSKSVSNLPEIQLHATSEKSAPVISYARFKSSSIDITVCTPGSPVDPKYPPTGPQPTPTNLSTSILNPSRYTFRNALPRSLAREKFEWRRNGQHGMKLVRCSVGIAVASYAVTDDGERRERRMRFGGEGAWDGTGLGEEFEILAVMSLLSLLERERKMMLGSMEDWGIY